MVLAAIERHGIGRASLRLAVPGVVVGLAIGLFTPLEHRTRLLVPPPRQPR